MSSNYQGRNRRISLPPWHPDRTYGPECAPSCAYKARHNTEEGAQKHVDLLKLKPTVQSPETLHTYYCEGCRFFYVGNKKAESTEQK